MSGCAGGVPVQNKHIVGKESMSTHFICSPSASYTRTTPQPVGRSNHTTMASEKILMTATVDSVTNGHDTEL